MRTQHRLAATPLTELLFEVAGVGLCLVAPDGTVVRANAEWIRSTGFELADVLGADVIELFPESRDLALAMHARARAGHRVEVPRHAQRVGGRETWWEGSISPVPMDGGTGLLITARDLTTAALGRDAADRRSPPGTSGGLRGADGGERVVHDGDAILARMREVADHAPAAVFVKDSDGRYVFANRRVADLLGVSPKDLVGCSVSDVLPPHVAERTAERERGVASGQEVVTEDTIPTPHGERVLLTARFPFRLASGDLGTCGIAVDVTDRKRAEEALRRSEERALAVSNNMRDHLVVLEAMRGADGEVVDWRYVDANDAALELLDSSRHSVR